MKIYKVLRIDEEDFGCEGRPEGYEPRCLVLLEDENGEQSTVKIPDRYLSENKIEEGDQVFEDGNGQYRLYYGKTTKSSMSTLCYIEQNGQYLMLHRTVKKNDVNKDKWIGVGGHFEANESPEECLLREVREETGYTLTAWRFCGIVTFISGNGVTEYMFLYTADGFEGTPVPCDEGELEWVNICDIGKLNLWEGDRIFLRLMAEKRPFFSLKLVYDGHDRLVEAILDGKTIR